MSRLTGGALAASGAVLAIAAVASVLLLSVPTAARAGGHAAHRAAASAVPASSGTTISARRTSIGTILVAPDGMTLYAFSRDGRDHDMCASIGGCLDVWPIMAAHGQLRAGHGVKASLLSTIDVAGSRQVTYAGHPLYTFAADGAPAATNYVGESQSGGTWPAVSPTGRLIH